MSNQEVAETLQSCPQQVRTGCPRLEEAQTTQELEEVSDEDKAVIEEPECGQPLEVYVGMATLPAMTTQELRAGQEEDTVISSILHFKSRNHKPSHSERMKVAATGGLLLKEWRRLVIKKGILYRSVRDCHKGVVEQLILPERLRETVKTALHNDSSHLGFERTLQMLRERFYWPRIFQEVKAWCEQCERCCLRKTPTVNIRAPLFSIHISATMELVCVDFLTLEKFKGGMENVLIVTDHFSRYGQAYPTRDQKAGTVARVLWRNFFCSFGLHADQGRNFESAFVKELCKYTGITKTHTTPYHPQGNGTTERFIRTLMNILETHVDAMTHAFYCS
ncbi:Pro-Pol poly [Labeo rohita]|uniref:Gypsy retrotransposon integrase-like protein 1 n=1 Tax=Labeo rohita TaxID=84645 RepID=A0A498NDU9_LABRO|nr:Pro-Pol poly [Labeo rohita]